MIKKGMILFLIPTKKSVAKLSLTHESIKHKNTITDKHQQQLLHGQHDIFKNTIRKLMGIKFVSISI